MLVVERPESRTWSTEYSAKEEYVLGCLGTTDEPSILDACSSVELAGLVEKMTARRDDRLPAFADVLAKSGSDGNWIEVANANCLNRAEFFGILGISDPELAIAVAERIEAVDVAPAKKADFAAACYERLGGHLMQGCTDGVLPTTSETLRAEILKNALYTSSPQHIYAAFLVAEDVSIPMRRDALERILAHPRPPDTAEWGDYLLPHLEELLTSDDDATAVFAAELGLGFHVSAESESFAAAASRSELQPVRVLAAAKSHASGADGLLEAFESVDVSTELRGVRKFVSEAAVRHLAFFELDGGFGYLETLVNRETPEGVARIFDVIHIQSVRNDGEGQALLFRLGAVLLQRWIREPENREGLARSIDSFDYDLGDRSHENMGIFRSYLTSAEDHKKLGALAYLSADQVKYLGQEILNIAKDSLQPLHLRRICLALLPFAREGELGREVTVLYRELSSHPELRRWAWLGNVPVAEIARSANAVRYCACGDQDPLARLWSAVDEEFLETTRPESKKGLIERVIDKFRGWLGR